MKKVTGDCFVALALLAMTGGTTGCPDDSGCTDCSCDPTLCDGGDADADHGADADADGDTPTTTATLHVETWTLSSDGTPRDLPGADAEVDGQHCTTPCDLEVQTGTRHLSLTLSGWVQGPNPLPFNLTTDGVVVNEIPTSIVEVSGLTVRHRLDRDLTGRWRDESLGTERNVIMSIYSPTTTPPCPSIASPDSCVMAGPFEAIGGLFVEGETLSLCKTHASECGGEWAEGQILNDGQRVEFTFYPPSGPPENYVYVKE